MQKSAPSVEHVVEEKDRWEQEARVIYEKACTNAKVLVTPLYFKGGKEELAYYHPSFTKEA